MPRPFVDITGQRFGKLVALRLIARSNNRQRSPVWRFRCDCGNEVETTKSKAINGHTRSCGCLKAQAQKQNGKNNATHGHTRCRNPSSEYQTWVSMRQRCRNKNSAAWKEYGGRGISVCERWHSFENFLADMGP